MLPISLILSAVTPLIDKLIPDPQAASEAKLKAFEMAQRGELAALDAELRMSLGQMEVNKAEASGDDPYTKRWRPTIGYILAAAMGFQFLLNPLLLWAVALTGHTEVVPPTIGLDDNLWELMAGMLGLAGWRTLDKIKGAAR